MKFLLLSETAALAVSPKTAVGTAQTVKKADKRRDSPGFQNSVKSSFCYNRLCMLMVH